MGIAWLLKPRTTEFFADYDDKMSVPMVQIDLPNVHATESFGHKLGAHLFSNAIVALIGPLGAGKTHLTRAIAEGLGIPNPGAVTSPTFTLIHEYRARLPIYHFDAYRLNNAQEFLDLGATEYFEAGGVCLIEWADRVESALPDERLTIRIEPIDVDRRRMEVIAAGETYVNLLKHFSDIDGKVLQ